MMKIAERAAFDREAWKWEARESALEFREKNGDRFPRDILLVFYPQRETRRSVPDYTGDPPIFSKPAGRELAIHLPEVPVPALGPEALRGWIHREAARMQIRAELGPSPFNFRKQFLPLFPVSGSAVGFMRQIVEGLRNGLDEFLATGRLLELGLGEGQVQFNAFRISSSTRETCSYRDTLPHGWTRASFLCILLPPFLAISCLASRGQRSGPGLKKTWWERHGFFIREDQALLEELAWSLDEDQGAKRYSDRLIALFIPMRDALLARHPGPPSPPTVQ